ncbi:MAG TPA: TIGR03067 domain-containing protein [Pyrinomonadaceae bacterium]|jgi:uncharacterized protein (TIGR03067 family)|nr:TIGR03067 domain-containing protein [Pyrinomonadaceae bacterium]
MAHTFGALVETMQGRWKHVYSEIDGQAGPLDKHNVLTYSEDKFSLEKDGKVAHEGKFTLDVTRNPSEIVYIYSKSFPIYMGAPRAGILQIEGNTLKCCFAPLGQPAPKDFNTFPNSERVLSIYQKLDKDNNVDQKLVIHINRRPPYITFW